MKIFSFISFVAFLSNLLPAFAEQNYKCDKLVLDGRHIQNSLDYAHGYQMANKDEYDEYDDDELFAIGTYKARYITKKVNIPFDITVGVTIHKVILWVEATGGGQNIKCKRTNLPADQYTEVFPSG